MACKCSAIDQPASIMPDQPCVYCAEKHFAAAHALNSENGYTWNNRLALIGELVLCQWHLFREHDDLAKLVRDIRHDIQSGNHPASDKWAAVGIRLYELTRSAVK